MYINDEPWPKELDEAAYVDGASHVYILRRVILPLAMPGRQAPSPQ